MTLWTGAGGGLLISILGRLNLSHLTVQVTVVLLLKWMGQSLMKNYLLRYWSCHSLYFGIGACLLLLLLKHQEHWSTFDSLMFLFCEVAFDLNKSTTCLHMEYCCYVWAGVPTCYLDILDRLQKWVCWRPSQKKITSDLKYFLNYCLMFPLNIP